MEAVITKPWPSHISTQLVCIMKNTLSRKTERISYNPPTQLWLTSLPLENRTFSPCKEIPHFLDSCSQCLHYLFKVLENHAYSKIPWGGGQRFL